MPEPTIDDSERRERSTPSPDFLTLPVRRPRPRLVGISHVLDKGYSLSETEQRLEAAAPSIDLWKLGWGTAYIDPALSEKIALLAAHGVRACPGGTLLELAWHQGVIERFLDWAEACGFDCVEVSCGSVPLARATKSALIERAAERFTVLAEVGSKDPRAAVSAETWARDAEADLAAGATWIVTEGRESGTVGLFDSDGGVRGPLVDTLVERIGLDTLIFEAPLRAQQAWLIRRYGANVNLGNINPAEALAVECLRLGLRSDTFDTTGGPA